jgi:tetratricopeptide (TPR) repeat protein
MSRIIPLAAVTVCLLALSPLFSRADEQPLNPKVIFKKTLQSTALVVTRDAKGLWHKTGTAWVVDEARKILITNQHVVGTRDTVGLMFPRYQDDRLVAEFSAYTDSMIIAAKVLDTDLQRDLAMIQVQELPKGVKELRITAGDVDVGETVHSVGNPGASGALWIYTSGTVRSVYRTKLTPPFEARIIETQAPINPGDSGGPVVNEFGDVVGVTKAYRKDAQLVGICINADEVKSFLKTKDWLVRVTSLGEFRKRGAYYLDRQRFALAVADLSEVIRRDPKDVAAYRNRGLAFKGQNEHDKAIVDFFKAIRLDPRDGISYRERAVCFSERGDFAQAADDFNEALRINDNDSASYFYRGTLFRKQKDFGKALADLDDAIRLNPKAPLHYYINRAETYKEKASYAEALAEYDALVRLHPDNVALVALRGMVYATKGESDRAMTDLDEAIRRGARFYDTFTSRASLFNKKKLPDLAIADCSEALKINAKYAPAYLERGSAFAQKESFDKAIADFTEAARFDPKDQLAHYHKARCYARQGRTDSAIESLTQSLELGYRNFDHLAKDSDLDSIRDDPRYQTLLKKYAKSIPTK